MCYSTRKEVRKDEREERNQQIQKMNVDKVLSYQKKSECPSLISKHVFTEILQRIIYIYIYMRTYTYAYIFFLTS